DHVLAGDDPGQFAGRAPHQQAAQAAVVHAARGLLHGLRRLGPADLLLHHVDDADLVQGGGHSVSWMMVWVSESKRKAAACTGSCRARKTSPKRICTPGQAVPCTSMRAAASSS